jgi:hypothetical protein
LQKEVLASVKIERVLERIITVLTVSIFGGLAEANSEYGCLELLTQIIGGSDRAVVRKLGGLNYFANDSDGFRRGIRPEASPTGSDEDLWRATGGGVER